MARERSIAAALPRRERAQVENLVGTVLVSSLRRDAAPTPTHPDTLDRLAAERRARTRLDDAIRKDDEARARFAALVEARDAGG